VHDQVVWAGWVVSFKRVHSVRVRTRETLRTPTARRPDRPIHCALVSRFGEPQDPDFVRMNTSVAFDRRLWPQDLAQSRAHAAMLAARDIISAEDRDVLLRGLERVRDEFEQGRFVFLPEDEDIHMAIERHLSELVGPVGGKLHTARSRNDQVATDLVMYTRERAVVAQEGVGRLMRALLERAEQHLDWPLPGYTHLQRAQPVYLSHHLLAYFWMLARDRERFAFAERQCACLPLGAGALAGVNFDTDRELLARELGFEEPAPNSIDAVSNRDFALDYLGAASTCATHLSRLGAELVLWSSAEFGFCELPDAWSAGSSIMPQKKNPDAAELLRAKAPRVVSHLAGLHGVMHALPLTYNKDLQEDKEHLFDAVDTLELALAAARGMVSGVSFDRERLAAAAGDELIAATDVADLLVRRGLPFREAHGVVAGLVRVAIDSGRQLSELGSDDLRAQSDLLADREAAEEYYKVLARDSWLESKVSQGGTALPRVREQLELARTALSDAPRS
jgi:argininosuccinate lyase